MHFRVRGNNVQVVKTEVDKKTLKSKSVPAGSANIKTGKLSEELMTGLNDKEIQEVRRWLEARQSMDKQRMQVEAQLLIERVREVTRWMKSNPQAAGAEFVAEAIQTMTKFRRTAIKLGLAKAGGGKGGGKGGEKRAKGGKGEAA